ncbi:MAG: hypothetical protein ABR903_09855, partial [Thermodesulfovibrionales bacterium]
MGDTGSGFRTAIQAIMPLFAREVEELYCGGPRGYRLMLKRQEEGSLINDSFTVEASIQLLIANHPEQPAAIWDSVREGLKDGLQSIDRRLAESGPCNQTDFVSRKSMSGWPNS